MEIDMTEKAWLTEKELAERLGFARDTIKQWRLKGLGPPFMQIGRGIRYNLETVKRWEAERQS